MIQEMIQTRIYISFFLLFSAFAKKFVDLQQVSLIDIWFTKRGHSLEFSLLWYLSNIDFIANQF